MKCAVSLGRRPFNIFRKRMAPAFAIFYEFGTGSMFVIFFEQRGRWKFIGVVVAIERGKRKAGLGLDNWNEDFCNLDIELVVGVEKCLSKMVEILNRVPGAVGSWEDFV